MKRGDFMPQAEKNATTRPKRCVRVTPGGFSATACKGAIAPAGGLR